MKPPKPSAARAAPAPNHVLAQAHGLADRGDIRAAIALLDQAVCRAPRDGPALALLGTLLAKNGDAEAAVAILKRATEEIPDDPGLWETLADAALRACYIEAARWCLDRSLALAPTPRRWLQRGKISQDLQRYDDAIDDFRHALGGSPAPEVWRETNELLAATFTVIGEPQSAARILDGLIAEAPAADLLQHRINLGNYLPPSATTQKALRQAWDHCLVSALAPPLPHINTPLPERPLRIGYVSADLRQHAVAFFIEAILEHHDRTQFAVYCYAANAADAVTDRLRNQVDHWRAVGGLSDAALADAIRRDQIDVLIDLSGHTSGNRLGALARKPAPVQIGYLGYPGPTGLSTIDFRITDQIADAPDEHPDSDCERLLRLPDCFHCYRPPQPSPARTFSPVERNGWVTFGSFNNLAKIGPDVLDAWATIMVRTPTSRLHLKSIGLGSNVARTRIRDHFNKNGVAAGRIVFLDYAAAAGLHFQHYLGIDIALDSFPYNGTTTTCEALWMSTPVVSWLGKTHPARVGGSLLAAAGLGELCGRDVTAYIQHAVGLAHDPARLQQYHRTLREQLLASPICNAPAFVRALEQAYRTAWQDWCRSTSS